jgi:hypothetical protein
MLKRHLVGVNEEVAGDDHDVFSVQTRLDEPESVGSAQIFVTWKGHNILEKKTFGFSPLRHSVFSCNKYCGKGEK